MDNADQVTQAVDVLVRLLLQDGSRNADAMDLDLDCTGQAVSGVEETKIKAAREYCLRILGR